MVTINPSKILHSILAEIENTGEDRYDELSDEEKRIRKNIFMILRGYARDEISIQTNLYRCNIFSIYLQVPLHLTIIQYFCAY